MFLCLVLLLARVKLLLCHGKLELRHADKGKEVYDCQEDMSNVYVEMDVGKSTGFRHQGGGESHIDSESPCKQG